MKGYKRKYGFDRIKENSALSSMLRNSVAIQVPSKSKDNEGGFIEGWVTVDTVWAGISPISAKQRDYYNAISTEITHLIRIRGNIACDATYRILFGSREFEILTVENIQEKNTLKILVCKERSR